MENKEKTITKKFDEEPPAFSDFKASVSKEEFEAILGLAESDYSKLSEALTKRNKLIIRSSNPPEGLESLPPGLLEKLTAGFLRKADREIVIHFSEELSRANIVVDFINRFRRTDDQLSYHDLSFIKNIKK